MFIYHSLEPCAEGGGQSSQQLHGSLGPILVVEQAVAEPLTGQHQELGAQNILIFYLQHHLDITSHRKLTFRKLTTLKVFIQHPQRETALTMLTLLCSFVKQEGFSVLEFGDQF